VAPTPSLALDDWHCVTVGRLGTEVTMLIRTSRRAAAILVLDMYVVNNGKHPAQINLAGGAARE